MGVLSDEMNAAKHLRWIVCLSIRGHRAELHHNSSSYRVKRGRYAQTESLREPVPLEVALRYAVGGNARHISEILMQGGNNTESICTARMDAQLGWMPWGKEGAGGFLHVQTPSGR